MHKGSQAFIEGRLNFQTWEAEGGQKRNKLEVVANNVQFLSKPGSVGGEGVKESLGGSGSPPATEDDIPF